MDTEKNDDPCTFCGDPATHSWTSRLDGLCSSCYYEHVTLAKD